MNKSKQSYRSDIEWHECSNLPDAISQLVQKVEESEKLKKEDELIADIEHLLKIKNSRGRDR